MRQRTTKINLTFVEICEIASFIEEKIEILKEEDSKIIKDYCKWLKRLNRKFDKAGDKLLFTRRDQESH